MKIVAYGFILDEHTYLRDPWNWLDFIVVITGLMSFLPGINANLLALRTFRLIRPLKTIHVLPNMRLFISTLIGSLVDLKASWKNMKKLGESKFENLASTQRTRDVSDRAYVIKLQREKELRDTQRKIIDNTKKLNQAVAKRKSIEAEIIDVKLNAFDEIIDEKTAAQTLTLK